MQFISEYRFLAFRTAELRALTTDHVEGPDEVAEAVARPTNNGSISSQRTCSTEEPLKTDQEFHRTYQKPCIPPKEKVCVK